MKANFLFAGLNQNRIIQKKQCQKKAHFMDGALKTKAIIYLYVGDLVLVCPPPYHNFWLRACRGLTKFHSGPKQLQVCVVINISNYPTV